MKSVVEFITLQRLIIHALLLSIFHSHYLPVSLSHRLRISLSHFLVYFLLLTFYFSLLTISPSFAKVYTSSCRIHQVDGPVEASDINQKLLKIVLNVANGAGTPTRTSMSFNLIGYSDMQSVKLYYQTAVNDSNFSTATLGGSAAPAASVTISGFTVDNSTANGNWFYWLVADMKSAVTPNTVIDAVYTGSTGGGTPTFVNGVPPINPTGFRLTARNYKIGTGEHYANVGEAAEGVSRFDYDGADDIFMELTSNYSGNAESSSATINFRNHTGPAKIIFRPAAGQTAKYSQAAMPANATFLRLTGVKNLVFDGRPGGTGIAREWVIRNTGSTTPVGSTINFIDGSSNNEFRYVIIEGDQVSTYPMIFFNTSSGSTGNNNNTFSNCRINDYGAGAGFPQIGIYSSGTSGKENTGNVIDSCEFVNIFNPAGGVSASIYIDLNSTNWTITKNHLYQTSSYAGLNTNTFCGIYVNSGSNFTITGNFIGGTAQNCGGTPFTITSGTLDFDAIRFGTVNGAITVSGNTISNISYTTTMIIGAYPVVGIALQGSANYICGSSGNGNTIGSMSTTGSITVTNNSGSGSLGFIGIYQNSSGNVTIGYNNIGGIMVTGSRINASCDLIGFGNALGTVTIQNNTLGGTIAGSISVLSDSPLSGIYNGTNTNGMTCNNNVIQNIQHSGAVTSTSINVVFNFNGPLTCIGNTIKNINTPSNNSHYFIRHEGTTANILNNTLQDITLTNLGATTVFYGIYLNTTSAVNCNSNAIGSATNNNISIAGDANSYGIYKVGTGNLSCSNNSIQEIYMNANSSSTQFIGVFNGDGKLTAAGNSIKNVEIYSGMSNNQVLVGIYNSSNSTGQLILKNTISGLSLSTIAANAQATGIYSFSTGSGDITKNIITGIANFPASSGQIVRGIYSLSGNWNLYNNVILLDNSPNTNDRVIRGIEIANGGVGSTYNVYHNTVKISGAVSSGTAVTSAYYGNNGAGTENVNNNIFQNMRTGGTGIKYAEYAGSAGIYNSNYNYLETSDPNNLCRYGLTNYNLAGWQGAPVNAANSISGTTILDPNGYAPPSFIGANAGFDLFTPTIVVDDRTDLPRDAAPWMGAYEGGTGNMVYVSSTADHFNEFSGIMKGSINNQILGVQIVMQNPDIPLAVIGFTFNTNGTTNPTGDIYDAKLWTTGQSSAFGTTQQLGSAVANPNGVFSFSGFTYFLNAGNNYFWLTYDVQTTAATGDYCDAECTSLMVDGITRTPTVTAPAGSRPIGTSWIGVTSIAWNTASNWANNQVPTSATDVFIPAGTPFAPTISTNSSCRDLTIKSGATLTNSPGAGIYFNIYGNIVNDGNYNDVAASTFTRLYGGSATTWGGSGTYLNGVTIVGNFEVMASADISLAGNITIDNLTIDANSKFSLNNYTCITQTDFTQNGNFYANSGTLESWGTGNLTPVLTDWGTGTLFLNHSFNLPFFTADDYYNLKIANTGFTTTIGVNLDIKNNFEISGGSTTVDGSTYTIKVAGSWINSGIFNPSTSTVAFNGIAQQNLGGTSNTTFNNLTINNTSPTGVIVQAACTVNTTLTLTDGVLNTDLYNAYVYLPSTASVSPAGGSAISYVDGFIQKAGTSAFIFPVGDGNKWRRIAIGAPSTSSTFRAKYFNSGFSDYTVNAPLTDVSQIEYWILDRMFGIGNSVVTLYWEDASASGIDDCPDLTIARWNGTSWNEQPATASGSCTGTGSGSITTGAAVTGFSPFTFGSKSLLVNPLMSCTPIPVTISTTHVTCPNACNGSAIATPGGGTAPFTYLWSGGENTASIGPVCAATYTVTVTDAAACTGSSSTTITEPADTVVTGPIVPLTYCEGDAVTVPYTIYCSPWNAGNVFTAQLSDAAGSFASPANIGNVTSTTNGSIAATIPLGTTAGSGYRIRVKSTDMAATGTDNGTDLTINQAPTANAGSDAAICQGSSYTLSGSRGGSATSSSWSTAGDGGFDNPLLLNATYTPGVTDISMGTVTLTLTTDDPDGAGPCTAVSDPMTLTIDANPTAANAGPNQILCLVTTAILAGNTPSTGTGNWTVVSGTATITTPTDPSSGVTGLVIGASATLRWTISNGVCPVSTDDVIITVNGPTTFTVTNTSDAGIGSLRQAIINANANCGHDIINFNLGAGGPFTITLLSALPNLTDNYGATINGWENGAFGGTPNTVPVFNATTATPMNPVYKIVLGNGNNIPAGLVLAGDSNIIQGLVLQNFGDGTLSNNDIAITISGDDNKVLGCYIGMNINGTVQGGTQTTIGIAISGANNLIGNGTAAGANLISGLIGELYGVLIAGAGAIGNTIKGNMIGLQNDGTTLVANALQANGVYITSGATGNKVGDIGAGDGNVISGHATFILPSQGVGVFLGTSAAGGNNVLGNIIGPRADGTNWVTSNGQSVGVLISGSPDNIIGGSAAAARNIISANEDIGVYITGALSTGNMVTGNKIGVSSASTFIANSDQGIGVFIDNSAVNNIIGGSGAGEGNIVSGQKSGIGFATGIYLNSLAASGNKVLGNIIGPMSDGITILTSNAQVVGINIDNSPNNIIGGATINERNIISANFTYGVYISGASSAGNVVKGNYIGPGSGLATITGSSQDYGVYLVSSAANNTIGGKGGGDMNVIAYNTTNGVYLTGASTTGNLISRNPVYSNTGKPINLNYGAGQANNGKATPVISSANAITVTGTSGANDTIEVFKNTTTNCFDAVTFVGQTTANGSGNWSLTGLSLSAGDYVLATASDAGNNTSEFSGCIAVVVNIIITETHVNVLCNGGNDGSIDITVSNGTLPYTYTWNDGPITEDRTNLMAGTYTVTVTDALLEVATKTVVITEPATALIVSETHTNVNCPGGSDGAINITAGGGTPAYTYAWNDGPVTEDRAGIAAGTYTVTVTDANNCTATNSVIINTTNTNSIATTAASASVNPTCSSQSTILSVTDGSLGTGASWNWYSGSCMGTFVGIGASLAVSPAATTTYYVRAEGTCNTTLCASVAVTVNVNPTPTITPGGPTTFCAGGNVTLSSSAATSYSWNTTETTQNITVSASGTYTVTVTDGNGCTGTDNEVVTVNANPTPTITPGGPTTFCAGGNVSLSSSVASSYSWSTLEISQNITVSASGTYTVTVTDGNGCTGTDNEVVTVNSNPTPTITPGGPTTFCSGGNVTLSSSAATSYSWNTTETTQNITVSASGTYTVTVIDGNGCTGTDNEVVTVNANPTPTITPGGPTTFCSGGNVTLSSSAATSYSWTTTETTQNITVSASGTYTVTVTDGNGCTGTNNEVVTVNSNPTPTITPGGLTTFCSGGNVTLSSSAATSYSWNTTETTQNITVSASGTYTVTVTDGNGCTGTDNEVVTVNPNPTPTITPGGPTTFCSGGNVTLSSSAATSYSWSTTETTQNITVSTGGTYTVTVTDGNGCTGTDSEVVTVDSPPTTADAGPDQNICNVTTTTLAGNSPVVGTGNWSLVMGTATITTPSDPASGVTGLLVSAQATLRWTISNGSCPVSTDDVLINVDALPTTANAGPDQNLCQATTTTLAGNTPAAGAGTWTFISGTATITSPSSPTSGVTGLVFADTTTLRWTISNGSCPVSTDDVVIIPEGPATFTVSNTADAGAGSLRQAIINANANCGHDTINFNLGAGGPFTIAITSALPDLTDNAGVTIDGWDNSGNDGTPNTIPVFSATPGTPMNALYKIILGNNNNVPTGLILASDSNTILGLVLQDFGDGTVSSNDIGINVSGNNNKILGCYLGMDATGTTQGTKTGIGISVTGANNQVGNGTAAGANLISGMNGSLHGIQILSGTGGNTVKGNIIGLQKDGSTMVTGAAQIYGIYLTSSGSSNTIGGGNPGEGNVISGNNTAGIIIANSASTEIVIGNIIGPQANGSTAVTSNPQMYGVSILAASNHIIGGSSSGERNIISANTFVGVIIQNVASTGNAIKGNFIGTDKTGTSFIANSSQDIGVDISSSAVNNTIGGTASGAGNLISGNTNSGVRLGTVGASGNTVIGNIIGPQANGISFLSSNQQQYGINIASSSNNIIGGNTTGARNIISANENSGINITGASSTGNVIKGNYIGIDSTGTSLITGSMQDYGVWIGTDAAGNVIGGTGNGDGNVLSGNKGAANGYGILLGSAALSGNTVIGNIIGPQADGTTYLSGNAQTYGVLITNSQNNIIGGNGSGVRNIISANQTYGIAIAGASSTGNAVKGNYIGVDKSGTIFIAGSSQDYGVYIAASAASNTVGGSGAGESNVISGNINIGIYIGSTATAGNTIRGNIIGPHADGISYLASNLQNYGIYLDDANNTTIGGSGANEKNIISGNETNGVFIFGFSGASGNTVKGNYIGPGATLANIPGSNQDRGVHINTNAVNSIIGGSATGEGNIIAYNTTNGIDIFDAGATGNLISRNPVYGNPNKAVNLNYGVNQGNNGKPPPTIAYADTSLVSGTSGANDIIEVFTNTTADSQDAIIYVGTDTADGAGNWSLPVSLSTSDYVVATARDAVNNTSELSSMRAVVLPCNVTLSINKSDVGCFGGSDGWVSATPAGGTGAYTYLWNNGDADSLAGSLGSGTFTVTVTDSVGCTTVDSATITQPSSLVIIKFDSLKNVTCNSGSDGYVRAAPEGGTPPYTYLWSVGDSDSVIMALGSGTYLVTVTDSNNCQQSDSIYVGQPGVWMQNDSIGTVGRYYAVGFSIGSKGYLGTGFDGSSYLNDFWEYDPATDVWTQRANFLGFSRSLAVGFSIGNKGYIGTGWNGGYLKDFWEYDPGGNSWTAKADFGGSPRNNAVGFSIGSKGYIGTGWDGTAKKDFWEYDPVGDNWTQKTDFGGTPRQRAEGFSIGNTGYIGTGNDGTYRKDFWRYNPSNDAWDQRADFGGTACEDAVSFSIGSRGYMGAGTDGSYKKDFWEYNSNADAWSAIADLTATGRYAAAGFSIGTKGYAGTGNNGSYLNDFWEWDPAAVNALTLTKTDLSCNGDSNGTAVATVTGGTAPLTYQWSNGETTSNTTGLPSGTYVVTVTDVVGCTLSDSINVTEPSQIITSVTSDSASCFGCSDGKASVSVSGGVQPYTFIWSTIPVQTNDTAFNLAVGTYSVSVSDSLGCTIIDNAIIEQPASSCIPCDVTVTTIIVDLTSAADSVWSTAGIGRNGYCCAAFGPDKCIRFVVITNANTKTISLDVTSPTPPGGSFFQLDCGPAITLGSAVCITGGVSYCMTFCKSGGDIPTYTIIASSANPISVGAGNDTTLCAGSALALDGTSSTSTGQWTTSGTGSFIPADTVLNATYQPSAVDIISGNILLYLSSTNSGLCQAALDTMALTINPSLLIDTISKTDVSCQLGNNGTIDMTISGGVLPYSFLWSNSETTEDIDTLTAGNYDFTVTDSAGCIKTTTITITEPSVLLGIWNFPVQPCYNECNGWASADGGGGTAPYTFNWSNGVTNDTTTGLCAGVTSVTLTDANGCTETQSVNLASLPAITLTETHNNVSCNGDSTGSVAVAVAGGSPPFTYLWSTGAVTSSVNLLPAGSYSVTVTDSAGCDTSLSVTITEPAALSVIISSTPDTCPGAPCEGTATANVTGGVTPYNYLWNASSQTYSTATGLCAGNYMVSINDANNCAVNGNVNVTDMNLLSVAPSGINATNDSVCPGDSVTLTVTGGALGGGAVWKWYSVACGGTSAGTGSAITVAPASSTTYYVRAEGLCNTTACVSTTVIVNSLSSAPIGATALMPTICEGDGSTLSRQGGALGTGASWRWYTDSCGGTPVGTGNPLFVSPSVTTTYYVRAEGICNTTSCRQVTVTVNPSQTSSDTVSVCAGDSVLVNGNWYSNSAVITDSLLTINSCDSIVTTTIIVYPTYFIADSAAICSGDSMFLGGSWQVSGGTYYDTLQTINGCDSILVTTLIVNSNPSFTVASTNVTCFGLCDGSAALMGVAGGSPPYTYGWSNGSMVSSVSSLCADTVSVTVTDANSCATSDSVIINQPTLLIATVDTSVDIGCFGDSTGSATAAAAGGSGSYSFLWSNGESTSSINLLPSSIFTVTITDANNCTASDSVMITEPPALSVIFTTTNDTCSGPPCDGTATATVSGGVSLYSYSWDANAGNQVTDAASGLCADTFAITITDANSCTLVATVEVDVLDSLSAPASSITVTQAAVCPGDSTTLTIQGGALGIGASWKWYIDSCGGASAGTGTSITVAPTANTIYYVRAEGPCDTTACISGTIAVNTLSFAPAAVTASPSTICSGDSAALVLSGGSLGTGAAWNWYQDSCGGSPVLTGVSIPVFPSVTTTYFVRAEGTCNTTSCGQVTVNVNPTYNLIDNIAICQGDSVFLSGSWQSAGGTYYDTLQTINGCDSIVTTQLIVNPNYSLNNNAVICAGDSIYLAGAWQTTSGTYTDNFLTTSGCDSIVTTVLSVNPPMILALSSTDASCFGVCDGTGSASVSGGTPPYSYGWSSGGNTPALSGLCAGVYTVTVTDSVGCAVVDSVSVTAPTAFVASINSFTDVSCFGDSTGSATVTASGGSSPYTYNWNTGSTTPSINLLPSSIYTVTVTDAKGCSDTASVNITQPSQLLVNVLDSVNIACKGDSTGIAYANVSGGTLPYTYFWSDPDMQVTAAATGLLAGMYTAVVTDANTCVVYDSVALTEPLTVLSFAITSVTDPQCAGDSTGVIAAQASGGTPNYTFSWTGPVNGNATNNPGLLTVTGLPAGNYFITVNDVPGCVRIDSATLTDPLPITLSFVLNNLSCFGSGDGSIDLTPLDGTPPYTYAWDNGETTEDIDSLTSATYTITVTDSNSCTNVAGAVINEPPALTVTFTITDATCGNSDGSAAATSAGGSGSYTYSWSNGDNDSVAAAVGSGSYILTVTDVNGCFIIDTAVVADSGCCTLVAVIDTIANTKCNGDSTGFATVSGTAGNPPYTYLWSNGSSQSSVSGVPAGTYTVTVSDSSGCVDTATVVVGEPQQISIVINTITNVTCYGGNNGAIDVSVAGGSLPYTFGWFRIVNPPLLVGLSEDLSNVIAGWYALGVIDGNGCRDSLYLGTIINQPPPIIASVSTTSAPCSSICTATATVSLNTVNPITSFNWSNGQTTQTATGLCSGDFFITVTDTAGCTDSDTGTVLTAGVPQPVAASPFSYCTGDTIDSLKAQPLAGGVVRWYLSPPPGTVMDTGNSYMPSPVAGTNYYYATQFINNCESEPAVIELVLNEKPVADAGENSVVCHGEATTLHASGGIIYAWKPLEGLNDPNSEAPVVRPGDTTVYYVTVTAANSCKAIDSVTVFVDFSDNCWHIYNMFSPNGDGHNDVWVIDGISRYPGNRITIYTRFEDKVKELQNYDNESVVWGGENSHGEPLPAGTYFYVIDIGENKYFGWVQIIR